MKARTRIAPSPTGFAHIGTIYQVLFDYAYAKKTNGEFIVRIEDTDRARFVEGAEKVIFDSLKWFGLEADEDPIHGGPYAPYRQSERLDIYKKYVLELIEKGHAYYCFCSRERLEQMREEQQSKRVAPMYDKHCLNLSAEEVKQGLASEVNYVVRMKVPENQKVVVKDAIVGEVEFDSNLIDHQVILKSDGFPTYHLAVVVDDYLMKITHIFRGTEWLPSTPKHILLYKYFGWENEIPEFIHLPLILNPDGKGKLSKRQESASVDFYKQEGYLPEAILNYLSNIVWNHPEGKEIYSLEEFIKLFEIKDLQAKGARFDINKLEWMNGEYIRAMSDEELAKKLREFLVDHPAKDEIEPLIPLVKERIKKLSDFVPLTDFIWQKPEYDKSEFNKVKIGDYKKALENIYLTLEGLSKPWKSEEFENAFKELAIKLNLNNTNMFQMVRLAVSGKLVTPPLFEVIKIIGEEEVLKRVKEISEIFPNIPNSKE